MANVYSNALDSGQHLSSNTVYYHFSDSYFAWNSYEEAQFSQAFSQWSRVANVRFVETSNAAAADFMLYNVDNSALGAGVLGAFQFPWGGRQEGYFNWEGVGWDYLNTNGGLQKGGFGFTTILHEIGHGLGLAHPHDRGGGSGLFPGVDHAFDTGRFAHNQGLYTLMSYNSGRVDDFLDPYSTPGYGWTGTPMAFDIYAIQQIYGANYNFRKGHDTYFLPETNDVGTFYEAIWDTGGRDWIRYDGFDDSTIDLRAASLRSGDAYAGGRLSSADGIYGGYTIANGVTIENANGGSGDDRMFGNQVRNIMQGEAGDDYMVGFAGDDRLIGHSGHDFMRGDSGRDQLLGHSGNDRLIGGGDHDVLVGGYDHDVLIGGSGNDVLRGQSGNDRMVGGAGDDRMFAGSGYDVMNGASGNDLMAFGGGVDIAIFTGRWGDDRIANFTLGEDLLDFSRIGGLNTFAQLTITDAGRHAIISFRGESVTLFNVNHNAIDADDVIL